MWIRQILVAVVGLASGFAVAAGLFSFIIGLGVVSDFADRTHTGKHVMLYENCIMAGGILGNIFWVYGLAMPGGKWIVPVFGLFSGIFVGCWSMALAEILNIFPIFIRRIKILKCVPWLIFGMALGKSLGALLFFYKRWSLEEKMKQQEKETEYETYVKEKTPVRKPGPAMAKAFVTGGIICTIGQTILNACEKAGMSKDISASWCSLILILASVVLTGFGIYPKIANWGGAGALVPITGFANSVAAPAIEYKKEGQVFGIGCKIFTIAGPVILYGVFTSWVLGLLYWIGTLIGIV